MLTESNCDLFELTYDRNTIQCGYASQIQRSACDTPWWLIESALCPSVRFGSTSTIMLALSLLQGLMITFSESPTQILQRYDEVLAMGSSRSYVCLSTFFLCGFMSDMHDSAKHY